MLGLTDVKQGGVSLEILKHPEAALRGPSGTPGSLVVLFGIEGYWVAFFLARPAAFSACPNPWLSPFL